MLLAVIPTPATTALVDRDGELAVLRGCCRRACAGEAVAVLVGGEAGVGKSRLVEQFAADARAAEARVLIGQCVPLGDEGPPLAPIAGALRQLLRTEGRAAFAGREQEFARLLPELGPVGPAAVAEAHSGVLFELLAGLLDRLAEQQPLVFVIEDLHWADRSTRDLIAFLIRSARTPSTLLVCTYRSDELHRGHPLRPLLAEMDRVREVERVQLERLDRDGTAQLLASLLGGEQPAAVIDAIHGRAQGNPFFTEELAACGGGDAGMPESLRDVLLARVDALPEAAQRVLRLAAAGGARTGHDLLAEVADLPSGELDAALRTAVAAQLLVADCDGGYEFRHALVREAIHDDLLPGERARLHARYASAIEAKPRLVVAGDAPAALAHHWFAANDLPRALDAALCAADAAGARYAYAERSRLLERVLLLWQQVPDAAERVGMDRLAAVELTIASMVFAAEDHRALALVRLALDEVERDEVERHERPLRVAWLLRQRALLARSFGIDDGLVDLRKAYTLAHRAPEGGARVEMLADIARQATWIDLAMANQVAREALAAAERIDSVAAKLAAMLAAARALKMDISGSERVALLREGAQLATSVGDMLIYVRAMVSLSHVLYEMGDYAGSVQAAAEGRVCAKQFGYLRASGSTLLSNQAEALEALGRWDEAEALCSASARLDPPGSFGLQWREVRARLWRARGRSSADGLVRQMVTLFKGLCQMEALGLRWSLVRLDAAMAEGAVASVAEIVRRAVDHPSLDEDPRYVWPMLAAAARVVGQAQTALGEHIPTTGPIPSADQLPTVEQVRAARQRVAVRFPAERAYAAQVLAEVAEDDVAMAAWRETVALWRVDGQPYRLAQALYALAEVAASAGERTEAGAALAEAGTIAATLDARPLAEAVQAMARRIGVRQGAPAATAEPATVLTEREQEVLRLVADGYSNRRIAEQLYISPKTASVHVSRIIAKLEVASRGEAAAVARRLGLV